MPIPGIPESYTPEFWAALEGGADPGTAISLARAVLQLRGGFPGMGEIPRAAMEQGGEAGFTRPQTGNRGQGGAGSAPGNIPQVGNPGERYAPGPGTGAGGGIIPREGPGQVDPGAIDGGMATLPFIPPSQGIPFLPVGPGPETPQRFIGIPDVPIPYDFFTEAIPQKNPGIRLPDRPLPRDRMMR